MPMILSDFTAKGRNEVRAFCQVYTGDFRRSFTRGCKLCGKDTMDTAEHLLGVSCEAVAESPEAQESWAEVKLRLHTLFGSHPVITQVVNTDFVVRFILDPTSEHLGEWRVSPEDLQRSGLDVHIRQFVTRRLYRRYKLLDSKMRIAGDNHGRGQGSDEYNL